MNPTRGILFKLLSVACFMAMSAMVKATANVVPPGEAMFFRSAFAIPPVLLWLYLRGDLGSGLKTQNPMSHVWRGLLGSTSMAFGFFALGLLPLPEVVAIFFAAPILATIFAAMFLGETIRVYRMAAVILGLVGVTIVIWPRLSGVEIESTTKLETIGAFAALLAAILAAISQVFVRKLVSHEQTSAIVFYFSVTTTLLSLLSIPFGWAMPDGEALMLLILSGFAGGLGQILLTSSYRYAETSVVAPFDYAQIIFALVIGYFIFDEVPTQTMIAGASLTVLAGLLIIWREARLGVERRQSRKALTPQG